VGSNATTKPNRCIDEEHPHTRVLVPCGGPAAVGGKPVCTAELLRRSRGHTRALRLQGARFSVKDPLNSAFLDGGVLHRTRAVYCRANHPPRAHHAHTSTHSSCLRHAFRHTRALSPRHTHESVHAQRGELRHARRGVGADSEGGVRVRGRRTSCGVLLSISVKLGEPRVRHR
jgi:hypothetical protein